jgi:hypothetical protein
MDWTTEPSRPDELSTCSSAPDSCSFHEAAPARSRLIGGQVLAVEQLAASQDSVLQVETDTGQRVVRGYSFSRLPQARLPA